MLISVNTAFRKAQGSILGYLVYSRSPKSSKIRIKEEM